MNKICVLAVYFGRLPASFEPWLLSCRDNPEIDFIVVTDSDADTKYANVSLCKMTLAEMKERKNAQKHTVQKMRKPQK